MGISLQMVNEFREKRDKKAFTKKPTKKEVVVTETSVEKEETSKLSMSELSGATTSGFIVDGLNLPLLPFQRAGVEYINRLNGRALNADEMGCVDGDAVIEIRLVKGENRKPKKQRILLKNLYKKFNGLSKEKWPSKTRVLAHCFNTDIRKIWLKDILAVNYSGLKKVYEIETKKGFLCLTGDHIVFTVKGGVEAKDLKTGDCVLSTDFISDNLEYDFVEKVTLQENLVETYDIVMQPPFHSFVANGLVIANSGKTVQSLAWVYYAKAFPLVVICPAHLKYNWQDEVKKWLGNKATCNVVISKDKKLPCADITVINYDIIKKFQDRLISQKYKTMILDECQMLLSHNSQRTKAAVKISKKIDHVIALSGTPFLNRPVELFNTLNIINPEKFSSFFKYAYRYCGPKVTPWGTTFKGATKTSELNKILRESVMVRRDKKTILPQLPEKTSTLIKLEPKGMSAYNKILLDKDMDVLPKMGALRQEAVRCKIDQFIEWCKNFLDNSSEKLLVFAHHQEFISQLEQGLCVYGSVVLTGKQSAEVKHERVNDFQTKKNKRVAIGSMRAINSGYNITATSTVAFLELDWNYSVISQCYSRVHRIGQKNHVNIYYFIANGTIDEHIYFLISNKLKAFDCVFDGGKGLEVVDREANIKAELAKILKEQLKKEKTYAK